MNERLVSVVVPIYRVENQLRRCVDSIRNQTYKNLEILLIDDGSPDLCPEICDEYAKLDSRIKVIHKTNAGLGMARNTGIDHATGEYICFFDSDDYIEPMTIEESCRVAIETGADLVCFGHVEETSDGQVIAERLPQPPKDCFAGEEVREKLIPMVLAHDACTGEDWNLSLSAWCELYSMAVIRKHNWRFVSEREIISEDVYSVLAFYAYVNKVAFIRKPFYHYVSNPVSLSKSYRVDRYERLKLLLTKLFELSVDMGLEKELSVRAKTIFLGLTIGALKQIVVSHHSYRQKQRDVSAVIRDDFMQTVLSDYRYSGESFFKRLLFWSMKHRLTWMTYGILKAKTMTEHK